mgnify:CR=1 FL=1
MSRKLTRRKFMAGTAAGAAAATLNFPAPAIAQAAPFKLGLLTVKTGPLAQGGIQRVHVGMRPPGGSDNGRRGRLTGLGGDVAGVDGRSENIVSGVWHGQIITLSSSLRHSCR